MTEQNDADGRQCQHRRADARNHSQLPGVTLEIVPAAGDLQQPVDAPTALLQRQEVGIDLTPTDALIAATAFAVSGQLLDRGLVLIRLDSTGEGHQLPLIVVQVGAIDTADTEYRFEHLLCGPVVLLFQAVAEWQPHGAGYEFDLFLQTPLAVALDRPQQQVTEAEHDRDERNYHLEEQRPAQRRGSLPNCYMCHYGTIHSAHLTVEANGTDGRISIKSGS